MATVVNPVFPVVPQPAAPEVDPAQKPEWAMSRREAENARRAREGLPRRRRRWPWVILVLAVLAFGAGAAWQIVQQRAAATAPVIAVAPVPVAEVRMQVNPDEVLVVAPQTLQRRVRVIGALEPVRRAELSSQAGGRVESVAVRPGDRVAEGDLLVQVDQESLTLELDLARSNAAATATQLDLAEIQLERTEALLDRGVTTTSSLDQARSQVEGLQANLSALQDQVLAAELRLRNASLRAPFDGIVSARNVDPGQYVQTGTPLLTLVDLSTVELQANAPVSAGALLQPGQAVSVTVDGIVERSFDGTVARINPVAVAGTRTIPVYITLDNADGVLLGGMFATGQIVVAEAVDAVAVPTDALREDAEGIHVLKIVENELVRQPIETAGDWAGRLTQVSAGLEPGEQVISAPLPELAPGDLVTLVTN